jgi:cytidine deaminase
MISISFQTEYLGFQDRPSGKRDFRFLIVNNGSMAKMKAHRLAPDLKVAPDIKKAYLLAKKARSLAHAPYSEFKVGATLLTKDGQAFTGCNVENASYGGAVCAERVAILKAVSSGEHGFSGIVVVTDAPEPAFPCALCLQIMAEFFDPETCIWVADLKAVRSVHAFEYLLPKPFGPRQLSQAKK